LNPPTSPTHPLSLHDALPICQRSTLNLARAQRSEPLRLPQHSVHDGFAFFGREGCEIQQLEEVQAVDREAQDRGIGEALRVRPQDRKSTRLNSSHVKISYAVF